MYMKPKIKKVKQQKRKRTTTRVRLPMNTGIQSTAVPVANSYGGIPYTSSQSQFGLVNKPPYLLESLIAKAPPTNYLQPTPAPTSSVTQGANIMTQTRSMVNQTKTQSVDFIDLVNPAKKGNNETQPEYLMLNTTQPKKSSINNEEKVAKKLQQFKKQEKIEQNKTKLQESKEPAYLRGSYLKGNLSNTFVTEL
jgi:hypothetical protein